MSETPIMRDILVAVTALPGGMFWRANVGTAVTAAGSVMTFNLPGMADIMGCYRERAVAIEVKDAKGKQRKNQQDFQRVFERAGGLYVIARSVDAALQALGVNAHG